MLRICTITCLIACLHWNKKTNKTARATNRKYINMVNNTQATISHDNQSRPWFRPLPINAMRASYLRMFQWHAIHVRKTSGLNLTQHRGRSNVHKESGVNRDRDRDWQADRQTGRIMGVSMIIFDGHNFRVSNYNLCKFSVSKMLLKAFPKNW